MVPLGAILDVLHFCGRQSDRHAGHGLSNPGLHIGARCMNISFRDDVAMEHWYINKNSKS